MNINNNFDNFRSDLANLKSKSKIHAKELDIKFQNQEKIYSDFLKNLTGQNWKQCLSNFKELSNNSKDMCQLMKIQNKMIQENLSFTENMLISLEDISKRLEDTSKRLASLEDSSRNIQILCYNDWVKTLINAIIVPGLSLDGWNTMSNAFARNISRNNNPLNSTKVNPFTR